KIHLGSEKFLLIFADDTELRQAVVPARVNLILPQLAAEGATGNAKLLGRARPVPSRLLQRPDDHLLFHVFQIAEWHCSRRANDRPGNAVEPRGNVSLR